MPDVTAGGPNEALGLPPICQPMPLSWHVARSTAVGPTGTVTIYVVVVDSVTGRFAMFFTPEDLRKFCDDMLQSFTGLVIAQPGTNGHPAT